MPSSRAKISRAQNGDQEPEEERGVEGQGRDGEAVGADRHKAGLAEVQQARVAEVDGEAQGGKGVGRRRRAE